MFVPVKAVAFTCGVAKLTANLLYAAGLTVTDNRSEPPADKVPSVAAIVALSALYKAIVAVATPLLKLMLVL